MKYLPVKLYKSDYIGTLNLSEKFTDFVIECPNGNLTKDEINGRGIIRIVKGNLPNTAKTIFVDSDGNVINSGRLGMFGGYFVYTSDSRFSELANKIRGFDVYAPVALHDRFE